MSRADRCSLTKLGYHAVFVIAIAMIVLDIVLRLFMIEQRTAAQWLQPVSCSETENLLGRTTSCDVGYGATSGQDQHAETPVATCTASTEGNLESGSSRRTSSVPAIVRLLCSGTMLVALGATIVDAMIWASFDTVHLRQHTLIPIAATKVCMSRSFRST